MPWSSWTTWSPVRSSAKDWSARPAGAARPRVRRRKTCVSGSSASPSSRQTKPRRAWVTANRSSASSGSSSPSSIRRASTRRSRFCVRSASPWCGNATTVRRPPRTNARSSFSASASPRAAIAGRCASNENGWPDGSGSSSTAFVRATGVELLLLPDLADVDRLPDEVRAGRDRRHEVGREPVSEPRRPRRPEVATSSRSSRRSAAG